MLYREGQFAASRKGEDGRVPTKSMKRAAKPAFPGAGSIRAQDEQVGLAVPAERSGANNERWSTKAKRQKAGLQKLPSCDSAVTAGDERSGESNTMVVQKDQMACTNISRGGFAEMQFKRKPHDLQNQEHSL